MLFWEAGNSQLCIAEKWCLRQEESACHQIDGDVLGLYRHALLVVSREVGARLIHGSNISKSREAHAAGNFMKASRCTDLLWLNLYASMLTLAIVKYPIIRHQFDKRSCKALLPCRSSYSEILQTLHTGNMHMSIRKASFCTQDIQQWPGNAGLAFDAEKSTWTPVYCAPSTLQIQNCILGTAELRCEQYHSLKILDVAMLMQPRSVELTSDAEKLACTTA
jgi:hypothetical protein